MAGIVVGYYLCWPMTKYFHRKDEYLRYMNQGMRREDIANLQVDVYLLWLVSVMVLC
jgi:hypothetical protein